MTYAIFGIENNTINLVVTMLVFFMVVIWLSLVYYTYADARRRVTDGLLVACATTGAFLFPFVGTIIWAIVRPPEYLEDVHERELEIRAAEVRVMRSEDERCPFCDAVVDREFLRCPECMRRLREPCAECSKPLNRRWRVCPYCEAEVQLQTAPTDDRDRSLPAASTEGSDSVAGESPGRHPGESSPVGKVGSATSSAGAGETAVISGVASASAQGAEATETPEGSRAGSPPDSSPAVRGARRRMFRAGKGG